METKLKFITLTVFATVMLCLIVVLVLVSTMPDLPTNDQICLPSKTGIIKCDSTTNLLHKYLERTVAQKYEEIKKEDIRRQQSYLDKHKMRFMNLYKRENWELKPAAKLIGKDLPSVRKTDIGAAMVPIREWRHGRELYDTYGFEKYGIRYRNGRFVVPVDGRYFINSNVALFESCDPTTGKPKKDDTSKPVKHGIYKFNILDGEEIEIASNVQPHVVSRNKHFNAYNSYVSTFEELKAGDEVSVKVSNITFLKYTKDNYFGINLI